MLKDQDIEKLSAEQKLWFGYAIAGMITADGAVSDSEISYLKEAINFLDSRDEINNIVEMVKYAVKFKIVDPDLWTK